MYILFYCLYFIDYIMSKLICRFYHSIQTQLEETAEYKHETNFIYVDVGLLLGKI